MEKESIKYGMLNYSPIRGNVNVGDFIQSLAAKQFLPQVDQLIDREELSGYQGDPVKMIMNGWYMTYPANWPPSELINPLFVSFHINHTVEKEMLSARSIEYLKRHEPIGCRDLHTLNILQSAGVNAYFSACLTLTLGETYKRTKVGDEIIIADVLNELPHPAEVFIHPKTMLRKMRTRQYWGGLHKTALIKQLFDKELLQQASFIQQSVRPQGRDMYAYADALLKRLSTARFVVTSRLHIALPCLAMNVPVIFINGGLYARPDYYRLSGLVSLMNQIHISKDNRVDLGFDIKLPIDSDCHFENPTHYRKYADLCKARCREFIKTE